MGMLSVLRLGRVLMACVAMMAMWAMTFDVQAGDGRFRGFGIVRAGNSPAFVVANPNVVFREQRGSVRRQNVFFLNSSPQPVFATSFRPASAVFLSRPSGFAFGASGAGCGSGISGGGGIGSGTDQVFRQSVFFGAY